MAIEYKGIDEVSGKGRYYDTATNSYVLGDLPEAEQQAQQQQTSEYLANNSADDDNSYKTSPPSPDVQGSDNNTPTSGSSPGTSATSTGTSPATDSTLSSSPTPQQAPSIGASTTQAGKAGDIAPKTGNTKKAGAGTGSRRYNPLGDFSSYTYQISLYMLTPEAYNAFATEGYKTLSTSEGAYLIAQSGGINNSGPTPRGKYFDLDFYIDNLRMTTYTPATQETSLNTFNYEFDIIEPMGFSFMERLVKTANYIRTTSKLQADQLSGAQPTNQQYVLAVRFYGYDKNGTVINGGKYAGADNIRADQSSVFERYYPIMITDIKFVLNGKPVTYKIKALLYDSARGTSSKVAMAKAQGSISAATVGEALLGGNGARGLIDILNDEQNKLVKAGTITVPNVFKIVFETPEIEKALLEQEDPKTTSVGTQVTTTNQNTVGSSNANKTGAGKRKQITIPPGKTTIAIIEGIVRQSTFTKNALNKYLSESPETTAKTQPGADEFQWFIINPVVKVNKWDSKLGDWSHTITYYIKAYDTPYVKSIYTPNTKKYYGPHKLYNYWFTGENSEVLNYEQEMNGLYYLTAIDTSSGTNATTPSGFTGSPVAVVPKSSADSTSSTPNKSGAIVDSVSRSLYSPADVANAKLTILGDPDYLDQSCGSSGVTNPPTKSTVGRDYTWNANGGQVFAEINFNSANDYDTSPVTGLMTPNEQIRIWDYPDYIRQVSKGVIYMVIQVDSTFVKGKFTQVLDLIICEFPKNAVASAQTSDKVRTDSATPSTSTGSDARKETTPTDKPYDSIADDPTLTRRSADISTPASDSTVSQANGTASQADQVTSDTRDTTVPTNSGTNVQDDEANVNNSSPKVVEPAGREYTVDEQSARSAARAGALYDSYASVRAANNGQEVSVPNTNTAEQQAAFDRVRAAFK